MKIKTPTNIRESNGVAVNLRTLRTRGDAYDLWRTTNGAVAYDANALVFATATEAEAFRGTDVAAIYPVYFCRSSDGEFCLHARQADEDDHGTWGEHFARAERRDERMAEQAQHDD